MKLYQYYDCRYNRFFHIALTFSIVITYFPTPVETTEAPVVTTYASTEVPTTVETTKKPEETTYASTEVPTTVDTTEKPTDTTDITKPTTEPGTSKPNNITVPPGLNFDFRYFVLWLILDY